MRTVADFSLTLLTRLDLSYSLSLAYKECIGGAGRRKRCDDDSGAGSSAASGKKPKKTTSEAKKKRSKSASSSSSAAADDGSGSGSTAESEKHTVGKTTGGCIARLYSHYPISYDCVHCDLYA
jgi:hypothetical protein